MDLNISRIIITSLLKLSLGLVCKIVRNLAANKLKDGDVAHQEWRNLIVRELNDITTKLDGLVRKDLLCSISYLKEGFCLVNLAPLEVADIEETKEVKDNLQDEASSILKHASEASSLVHVLSAAAKKLKITSEGSFATAKPSFKLAYEKATEAFNNEALSIEDRIFATKVRMITRILEILEDPDRTAETCKLYLEELHGVPAVKEIFSVYLHGAKNFHFYKKFHSYKRKRLEIVMSVNMINLVLYDAICKFTKLPLNLFNWPRIEIGDRAYHPILENSEIVENVKQSGDQSFKNTFCSVNSKREIVTWHTSGDIKVLNKTTSEWSLFCTLSNEMIGPNVIKVYSAIAVDGDDNVYIVVKFETTDDVYHFTLFVFDTNGNLKYEHTLGFLDKGKWFRRSHQLVVSKDICIIHTMDGESTIQTIVWVCDQRGRLLYKFHMDDLYFQIPHMDIFLVTMCVSDKNEIIAAKHLGRYIYIYTEEGEMKRKIEVPEGHEVSGVAFNHIAKTIIVGTWVNNSYFLTSWSETGEQQDTFEISLGNTWKLVEIISHPSGNVVLVQGVKIVFI